MKFHTRQGLFLDIPFHSILACAPGPLCFNYRSFIVHFNIDRARPFSQVSLFKAACLFLHRNSTYHPVYPQKKRVISTRTGTLYLYIHLVRINVLIMLRGPIQELGRAAEVCFCVISGAGHGYGLYEFAPAAITKHHRPGASTTEVHLLKVLVAGIPRSRFRRRPLLLASRWPLSCCVLT